MTPSPHSAATHGKADAAPGSPLFTLRARHLPTVGDWLGGISLFVILTCLLFLPMLFH